MRGSPDPATSPPPVRLTPRRSVRAWLAAGALATGPAALTGGLASPLVGLAAFWLHHVGSGPLRRIDVHLLVGMLLILGAAGATLRGAPGPLDLAGAMFLAGVVLAGRLTKGRRSARTTNAERRLAAIDAELARPEAARPEVSAARRIDAIRESLVVAAATAGAERAALWDVDLETRRLAIRMASDGPADHGWLPMAGNPLGWLAEEGQPLRFDALPPVTARSATAVALRMEHDPTRATVLSFEYTPDTHVPEPDALAGVVHAVQRVLGAEAERAAHDAFRARVEILLDTLDHLPDAVEPGRFARDLVSDACRLTSASGGALLLWDHDQGRVLAAEGVGGGPPVGARVGPAESEAALAARAGTIVRQNIAAKKVGPDHVIAPGERWQRRPSHLLCLPLHGDGLERAILCVWDTAAIDAQGSQLLERLAPFAGSQLARALEFGRVRDNAERDALTALPNRHAFERALEHERLRFDRYGHTVALLVIDVDHFKAVNDTHGHEAGDAVLRAVADCLRTGVREIDTIARFGGEEFVILMPETGLPAAAEVAQRLRETVEADRVVWRGVPIPVRVSIGAAACPDSVASADELLRSADAALYQAKAAGRNRVVTAPPAAGQSRPDPRRRRRP